MRHLLALILFLFATASIVDRANAEASDAVKNASKVILNGKQFYETERASFWVFEDKIYICTTTARVRKADGSFTTTPAMNCVSQLEKAKPYFVENDFKHFEYLTFLAYPVLYVKNAPAFSTMVYNARTYTFDATNEKLYVCTTNLDYLVCRLNDELTDFDILY